MSCVKHSILHEAVLDIPACTQTIIQCMMTVWSLVEQLKRTLPAVGVTMMPHSCSWNKCADWWVFRFWGLFLLKALMFSSFSLLYEEQKLYII